jgi:hypothetical protein
MNKRVTAIGLTAGLLAGAGAGFIFEHSGGAGASARPLSVIGANNGNGDTGDPNTGDHNTGGPIDGGPQSAPTTSGV